MEPHGHDGGTENAGDGADFSAHSVGCRGQGQMFSVRKQPGSVRKQPASVRKEPASVRKQLVSVSKQPASADSDSNTVRPAHHHEGRENCGGDVGSSLSSDVHGSEGLQLCVRIKPEPVEVSDCPGHQCRHGTRDSCHGGTEGSQGQKHWGRSLTQESEDKVDSMDTQHYQHENQCHKGSDKIAQELEYKVSDVLCNHSEKKTNSLDSNSVLFDQTPRPGISLRIQQDLEMEQEDFEALHQPSRERDTNTVENHSQHIPYKTERQHISSEPEVNSEHFVESHHHTEVQKTGVETHHHTAVQNTGVETHHHTAVQNTGVESHHHTAVQKTGEDLLKAMSDCVSCEAVRQGISVGIKQEAGLDQEQWDAVQPTRQNKAKDNKHASSPSSFETDRPRSCVRIKQEPVSVEDLWDTTDHGPEVDSARSGHSCSHPILTDPRTSLCSVKGHSTETDMECAVSCQQKTTDSINSCMTSGIAFKKLKSETWLENQPKMYGSIKINTSSASVIGFQGKTSEFSDESDSETLPVHFQVPEVSLGSKNLYECALCQLTFSLPAQLHEHIVDHDADCRHYSCAECHTSFQHLALLTQHVITHTFAEGSELQYDNQKSFVCHVCSKVFRRLYELNRHQKIHSGSKPFVCDVCHKAFARGDELNRHKRVHSGVKPYQCDECTRAFITNHELSQHKKSHSESKPFECPLCSRGFLRADKLFHHEQMHAGLRSFECDVCPKAFITQSELNQHKKIHSGMKPFVCEVCCKAYLKVNDLNRHMKMHTGQKPYVCDVCSKAFHRADILSRHKKIHTRQKRGKQDI